MGELSQEVQVRRAKPEDKEQIIELCTKVNGENDYIPGVLDGWIDDTQGELTIALLDGKVVGISKMTVLAPGYGWLEGARVNPDIQGKGVGRAFTNHQFELAKAKGIKCLAMATNSNNTSARTLASRLGFELAGEYQRYRAETLPQQAQELPVYNQLPPVPKAELISAGWTFHPWRDELVRKWVQEGKLRGDSEAGLALLGHNHRAGRVNISLLWGEPKQAAKVLKAARYQPKDVERISFITEERRYHDALLEAGFEHFDGSNVVVYRYWV